MYVIEFVEIDDKKPFKEFLNKLQIEDAAKIINTIDYFLELKNSNLPIKENISKYLEDGIFEIRIYIKNKITRAFYYYIKDKKIIITHGIIKKSQKTPAGEIRKAKKLREKYNKYMNYDKL
jgi:phage-related protein